MALTNTGISKAKPGKKPSKMYDARGLFLLVNPNGSKWWRFKYRFNGKEKLLSLGVYPEVTLKRARDTRDEARERVARGIDPPHTERHRGPPGESEPSTALRR